MNLRCILAIGIFATSSVAAPVPKELKRNGDAERMRGVWLQENGMRWYFDESMLYVGGSDTANSKGKAYRLATRPGAGVGDLDFGGGQEYQYHAIYQFAGDDLRLAYVGGGKVRPKDFTARPGELHHVLKRLPEGKE